MRAALLRAFDGLQLLDQILSWKPTAVEDAGDASVQFLQ